MNYEILSQKQIIKATKKRYLGTIPNIAFFSSEHQHHLLDFTVEVSPIVKK